jgi:uncharacterized membrane protein
MFGSPWHIIIGLGIPLIYIAVIGFALVVVLRLAFKGKGMNTKAVHVELLRIDERLTSIEKLLKDIE